MRRRRSPGTDGATRRQHQRGAPRSRRAVDRRDVRRRGRARGHEIAGRSAFLLGVGGAGAAIAAALADASIGEVVVRDVDAVKRDATVARIARAYPRTVFRAGDIGERAFDFAINATPLGLRHDDPLPFDATALPRSTVVVDVIATPEMTPLLQRASESGHAIQTGRHLHEGQAVGAARFFGFET